MVFGYTFEPLDVVVFLTLIMLEGVLSFDNAAVLAAMVRRLPPEMRRKALFYGLIGAYVFRIAAILLAATIIRYPAFMVVGGAYLILLAVRHLAVRDPHGTERGPGWLARIGISGFWGTVIALELADLAFALDQVLAAVALTKKIHLIIAASMVAILFLRLSAIYIVRLMDWFPALEKLAYIAVGWVGIKLLVEAAHLLHYIDFEIPRAISLGVTVLVLVVPVLGKVIYDRLRPRPSQPPPGDQPPPPPA